VAIDDLDDGVRVLLEQVCSVSQKNPPLGGLVAIFPKRLGWEFFQPNFTRLL